MLWKIFKCAAVIVAAVLVTSIGASAHVTLDQKTTAAGPYKAVFGVPHGCSGSATVAVRVAIPEGFIGVKPMPKPGWTVATTRGAYARTYDYFHGAKLSEGVTQVVWSGGKLPDDYYDEFTVIGFVSDAFHPGDTVYFPVTQECETGSLNWNQIPPAGVDPHMLKTPAAALKIVSDDANPVVAAIFKGGDITIEAPWAPATPAGSSVGAAYLRIVNQSAKSDQLIAAKLPLVQASAVTLARHMGPGLGPHNGPHMGPIHSGPFFGHHHRHFRNFVVGVPYYDYDYYGGYGDCGWLHHRAAVTGSRYWWRRYYECVGSY